MIIWFTNGHMVIGLSASGKTTTTMLTLKRILADNQW